MADRRPVLAEDLLRFKTLGDPHLSPDGTRVVYTVKVPDGEKNKYWSHLFLADVSPDQDPGPRKFTHGEVADGAPRWSPDGRQIVFLRAKDRQQQFWIIAADGGESRQLTHLDDGHIGEPVWSPDGQRLAFTFRPTHPDFTRKARKEREESGKSNPARHITRLRYREDGYGWLDQRQHIWLCDVLTGQTHQLTGGDEDDDNPTFSPDGSRIAFVSNRSPEPDATPYQVDIWTVPVVPASSPTESFERVPTPTGYKGSLAWSPDGRWISYVGVESKDEEWVPRHNHQWVVPIAGGAARDLTARLDRSVGLLALGDVHGAAWGAPAVWSADSSALYFLAGDSGNAALYRVSVAASTPEAITRGAQVVTGYSVVGDQTVVIITTPTTVGELYALSGTGGEPRRLTAENAAFEAEVRLVTPEEFWIDSTDGARIQTWILKPPDFDAAQTYPAIFSIHGGPHAQYGNAIFHELQWHAARGYVVVYANPRGSANLDEAFLASIRGAWGQRDIADLMAVADFIERLPYVDTTRIAVCGGSYGGYATSWIVGQTDRFACAVADRSVVDLVSMWGTTDFAWRENGYWPGNPWTQTRDLIKASPLSYLANVTTPLLIIHSEGDWRCPIGQSQELYLALKLLGKAPTEFIWYPAETSHGMSRAGPPDLRLDRLRRYADWFDRYLRSGETTPAGPSG